MIEQFDLDDSTARSLVEFWKSYNHLDAQTPGFLRFAHAPFRPMVVDRVFDYVCALEQLFTVGEQGAGYGYRVSCRCSSALARSRQEAGKILEVVRKAYQIRNAVAHGSLPKENDNRIVDVACELRCLVRRAIRMLEADEMDGKKRKTVRVQLWRDLQVGGPLYLRGEEDQRKYHFECQHLGLVR